MTVIEKWSHNLLLYRSNNSGVISGAIELLVHACSSHDRAIRLAGQENLHKLVKVSIH